MASLAAEVRRSRRTLERMGMTPEEELEQLIKEQELDDTYRVNRPGGEVSLDATNNHNNPLANLIGVQDGDLVLFTARTASGRMKTVGNRDAPFSGEKTQHGTIYGYKRLLCRCLPCTVANKKHMSGYRARRRAAKKAAQND